MGKIDDLKLIGTRHTDTRSNFQHVNTIRTESINKVDVLAKVAEFLEQDPICIIL